MTFKTEREIMKIADHIEALAFKMVAPNAYTPMFVSLANEIRTAIHTRLAQPEQEPVAWADKVDIDRDGHDLWVSRQEPAKDGVPLYTAPIKKEWVELSDEEMDELVHRFARYELIRAVETKLKEKNI